MEQKRSPLNKGRTTARNRRRQEKSAKNNLERANLHRRKASAKNTEEANNIQKDIDKMSNK